MQSNYSKRRTLAAFRRIMQQFNGYDSTRDSQFRTPRLDFSLRLEFHGRCHRCSRCSSQFRSTRWLCGPSGSPVACCFLSTLFTLTREYSRLHPIALRIATSTMPHCTIPSANTSPATRKSKAVSIFGFHLNRTAVSFRWVCIGQSGDQVGQTC